MKVTVDADLCRGHGVCVTMCPAVFRLNDDGYTDVLAAGGVLPDALADEVNEAADACPEQAITAN